MSIKKKTNEIDLDQDSLTLAQNLWEKVVKLANDVDWFKFFLKIVIGFMFFGFGLGFGLMYYFHSDLKKDIASVKTELKADIKNVSK